MTLSERVVRSAPPVHRSRYTTSDPDEGTDFLRARYTDLEPVHSRSADFVLDVASEAVVSPLGPLRVDRLRYGAGARAEVEPYSHLAVGVALSGRSVLTHRGRRASGVALMPTWDRFGATWDDIDVLICSLEPDTVRRVGAELSGLAPEAVVFRDMAAIAPDRARAFATLLAHLKRDRLPHDQVMASPLVRAETLRHLATTLLLTFPNTALDVLGDPDAPAPGRPQPATVRRAVAFIDDHAHEPIGPGEIAAAAGTGVRGLQHAFRRHRDTTPLAYLREVRLARAHRDLQACDPASGDTVAAVATRWGFTHHGRFAVEYRRAHGCSPSETLRG